MAKNYKCDEINYKMPVELYFNMKHEMSETDLKALFGEYKANVLNARS